MSGIQSYTIHLTIEKLEHNPEFLQAWGLWKVKNSFTKRTQGTSTTVHPSPGTLTGSLPQTDPGTVEQNTQIYTMRKEKRQYHQYHKSLK